ncbi:TVP38/TMEM64 family protein [Maridesulfovibrio sp.]|uniref:TVP38/TMEM64 family protein n=1 Tax=Maridesulfovibrio sp. TaxID=2795000 RepID=UPI0029CA6BE9|nr:TVP38/TMEM64 family protein [Maridesulfovibrio sp.]
MKKKILILLFIVCVAALFFIFDLDRFLTLEYLKNSRQEFQLFYDRNPLLTVFSFFWVYVLVVGVNLPGATVLGLAGGALLGFKVGVLTISFASTIGATLACFFSRYLFRDYVQQRFGDRLDKVNRGIKEEGAFYLFSLRLIPAVPFVIINLVMGLTPMKLRTFYWVSQLGMLPGTMVYVNAGKELGHIDSLSGIVQPGVLISFILLGIFPLIVKRIVGLVKKHRSV